MGYDAKYAETNKKSCKRWRSENPEKKRAYDREYIAQNYARIRHKQLMSDYGISYEQYLAMEEEQGGCCSICERPKEDCQRRTKYGKVRALEVDHCHKTGKIRGLLCASCNTTIGHMEDDTHRLRKAINYLER